MAIKGTKEVKNKETVGEKDYKICGDEANQPTTYSFCWLTCVTDLFAKDVGNFSNGHFDTVFQPESHSYNVALAWGQLCCHGVFKALPQKRSFDMIFWSQLIAESKRRTLRNALASESGEKNLGPTETTSFQVP